MSITATPPSPRSCAPRLAEMVDELRLVVGALEPSAMTGRQAGELVELLGRVERISAAGKTMLCSRVAETGEYRAAGASTAADWLAGLTGVSRWTAANTIRTTQHLGDPSLEPTRAAFLNGDLSEAQANEIASAAAVAPDMQPLLLGAARRDTLRALQERCRAVRASGLKRPERKYGFGVSDDGHGTTTVRTLMPTSWAVRFLAAINLQCEAVFRAARQDGRRAPHRQYMVEALVRLVTGESFDPSADAARWSAEHPDPDEGDDSWGGGSGGDFGLGVDDARDDSCEHAMHDNDLRQDEAAGDDDYGHKVGDNEVRQHEAAGDDDCEHEVRSDDDPLWSREGSDPSVHEAGSGADETSAAAAEPSATTPGGEAAPVGCSALVSSPAVRAPARAPAGGQTLILCRVDQRALMWGYAETDETCDIPGIGPVPVSTVRELWPGAVVKLVLTKGEAVQTVVTLSRRAKAAMYAAMLWESPLCSNIACDHRHWIQVDHRVDFAKTRHTTLPELDRLCQQCHDRKTRENWALAAGRGRRAFVPPGHPLHPSFRDTT